MRLCEITDEDKDFLTLKDVEYDFEEEFNLLKHVYDNFPNSSIKSLTVASYKSSLNKKIRNFLNQGFDQADPDVIRANELYNQLSNFKI